MTGHRETLHTTAISRDHPSAGASRSQHNEKAVKGTCPAQSQGASPRVMREPRCNCPACSKLTTGMRVLETSVLNYCLADTYEAKSPSSREAQACNAVQVSIGQRHVEETHDYYLSSRSYSGSRLDSFLVHSIAQGQVVLTDANALFHPIIICLRMRSAIIHARLGTIVIIWKLKAQLII